MEAPFWRKKNEMKNYLWLIWALSSVLVFGQEVTSEQRQRIDAAIPNSAAVKPLKPRRMLISTLSMRNGQPVRGHSARIIPIHNYAFEQLGKRTGAYEPVFSNDIEMLRPENIQQFDAICFLNTVGVLFDDPELRKSLLDFVAQGKGFVGIHDAIATFVEYPVYDQWPEFGRMLGGTENGGHPWNRELMTIKLDDPDNPVNAAFHGQSLQIADQAFQLQELSFRDRLHVLYSVDVEKTDLAPNRRILPQRSEDMDFPMGWIKAYGKGRVFYGGLGHSAEVYWNPQMLEHFLAGIQYALGDLKADDSPSGK